MKRKYIPDLEGNLTPWLQNLVSQIPSIGASLGMSAADIKAVQDRANAIINKISITNNAKIAYTTAKADKETEKTAGLDFIIVTLTHLMANPGWTDSNSRALGTSYTPPVVQDFTNYKPEVKCKVAGGEVRFRILKRGIQAVNIYARTGSTGQFVLLERVSLSTYIDTRPLTTAGIAEIRQYMVMGVMNDKEVGLPSDIITVSYAG